MTVKQFRGGSSNLTYLLRFGDREWVMRRPPFGPLPVGGHDMGREYRVLSRLWEVFKPAPRAMLFSDDASIIGAPFFVMERRRASSSRTASRCRPSSATTPRLSARCPKASSTRSSDLHGVDYAAIGLASSASPTDF